MAARANQVFDGFGRLFTLSLLEFGDPIRNRIDDVTGSLTDGFGLVPFAINAFSAFYDFYFFLGHKLKGERVAIKINEIFG